MRQPRPGVRQPDVDPLSSPSPRAALYEQEPALGHVALDFARRLRLLLEATAVGLFETLPPGNGG